MYRAKRTGRDRVCMSRDADHILARLSSRGNNRVGRLR
jgi:hypothetical protein